MDSASGAAVDGSYQYFRYEMRRSEASINGAGRRATVCKTLFSGRLQSRFSRNGLVALLTLLIGALPIATVALRGK